MFTSKTKFMSYNLNLVMYVYIKKCVIQLILENKSQDFFCGFIEV